jgi:hypothetical protein
MVATNYPSRMTDPCRFDAMTNARLVELFFGARNNFRPNQFSNISELASGQRSAASSPGFETGIG